MRRYGSVLLLFFFNETATTEIYTLSLHDALPISTTLPRYMTTIRSETCRITPRSWATRSEEHTSELQSHVNLVCRLLLEKKKNKYGNRNLLVASRCETSVSTTEFEITTLALVRRR